LRSRYHLHGLRDLLRILDATNAAPDVDQTRHPLSFAYRRRRRDTRLRLLLVLSRFLRPVSILTLGFALLIGSGLRFPLLGWWRLSGSLEALFEFLHRIRDLLF